jgi:uncharacterized protein (DUF1015 family)
MATVIPFKGVRPQKNKVHLVASRSVTTYTAYELKKELEHNPYSFLQIIHPKNKEKLKTNSIEYLQKIKAQYSKFIDDKTFIKDATPCYYVYQQKNKNNTYTGIIGCCSIDDYLNGTIKIHEQTITEREEKLKNYLEVCDFNAEPVLFSYPNNAKLDSLTHEIIQSTPDYDFVTEDAVSHKLWAVSDTAEITTIQNSFEQIPNTYIADGHHRSASSVLYGKMKREQQPDYTGKEAFNYYLGIFFPESELKIFDYNRVIKDLNGLSEEALIEKISMHFLITPKGDNIYRPSAKHNFSMYLQGKWYSLDAKQDLLQTKNPVKSLDSWILSEYILSPVFDIHNLKTDKRIDFMAGIKGMEALKKQVDEGKYKIAFALYPVQIEQLKQIADSNNSMPPKSTWIEPKMRSGLVIYELGD